MKRKASAALIAATSAAVAKRRARWQRKFLDALAKVPSVKAACQVAGVNRTLVYKVRKSDLEFAALWQEAIDASIDQVESEALKFALQRPPEGSSSMSAWVNLVMFVLRSHKRSTYGDKLEAAFVGGVIHLPMKTPGPE